MFLIAFVVIIIVTTCNAGTCTNVTSDQVNILVINQAIDACGANNILQTCSCLDPNDVLWTKCLNDKVPIPDGPAVGDCLSMEDIDNICNRFEDPNEIRVCPKPTYPKEFDVLILQNECAKCGAETIVDTCHCKRNQLYWTQCIYDALGLEKNHCPEVNTCVSLTELKRLYDLYTNYGRQNCPSDCTTNKRKCQSPPVEHTEVHLFKALNRDDGPAIF